MYKLNKRIIILQVMSLTPATAEDLSRSLGISLGIDSENQIWSQEIVPYPQLEAVLQKMVHNKCSMMPFS